MSKKIYNLNLTSSTATFNGVVGAPAGVYKVLIDPPLNLTDAKYKLAITSYSLWFSMINIGPKYQNQLLRYYNGVAWFTITMPAGNYSLDSFNQGLKNQIDANGGVGTNITFVGDQATQKLVLQISGNYQIDLTQSLIYELLGFNSGIYPTTPSAIRQIIFGQNLANFNAGFTQFFITLPNLVDGSYSRKNGAISNVAYNSTFNVPENSLQSVKIDNFLWTEISSPVVASITVNITDEKGQIIDFNQNNDYINQYPSTLSIQIIEE